MDHREVSEYIIKNNGCAERKHRFDYLFFCFDCPFEKQNCITQKRIVTKAKQWLKDNPKEEKVSKFKVGDKVILIKSSGLDFERVPDKYFNMDLTISMVWGDFYRIKEYDIEFKFDKDWFKGAVLKLVETKITNEQKIKELEEQIKAKQSEIEELKKPKYEIDSSGVYGIDLGRITHFETEKCRDYFSDGIKIYLALAKFSEKYDPIEIDRKWDSLNAHYFVRGHLSRMDKRLEVDSHFHKPFYGIVYFSTKELAESALEMLKREGLI